MLSVVLLADLANASARFHRLIGVAHQTPALAAQHTDVVVVIAESDRLFSLTLPCASIHWVRRLPYCCLCARYPPDVP
ncbi:hypothetical protein KCP75_02950 [Salmonella enterica subsp. enterica]|nr:hypothetical protein KCP75_02950 [Salmonella enterica subsp. enterica]